MTPSLWSDTAPPIEVRPPLGGDTTADVAIIGGGYTGLWTAYELAEREPAWRIVVIEAETVGYGASGRNGGWCVGELSVGLERMRREAGEAAAVAQVRALHRAVDEVGRVVAAEGIDCHYAKGGTVRLARNQAQLQRLGDDVDAARAAGFTADDVVLLDAAAAMARVRATDVLGGLWFAHTAALHPLRLVRGLGTAAERRGVEIVERTRATKVEPGVVTTDRGIVRAPRIVRAIEGYTAALAGHRRDLAPLYSLMVATEPLTDTQWGAVGLANRETFADDRHLVIYGQRTGDGRFAFGGRGAPYGFGSRIDAALEGGSGTHELVAATLIELFPVLAEVAITHRWGGVLGVPRDWHPTVRWDAASGIGTAGGYVGDGVAAANLAGRTLADLLVGADTDLTRLPWVGHRSRRWEPEPLRWLGINGALRVMASADRREERGGATARRSDLMWRLMER